MNTAYHRRSIRLKDYDYTQNGAYFVTICTHQRMCLFGTVNDGVLCLNALGGIAAACWDAIPAHFPHVELDASVVMPNHVHGIIVIVGAPPNSPRGIVGATHASPLPLSPLPTLNHPKGPPSGSLGAIIGSFKSAVTRQINLMRDTPAASLWQRNFHEHILHNTAGLDAARLYIESNPSHWQDDDLYMRTDS
jgi:REP element-mobilizing transposase RayT